MTRPNQLKTKHREAYKTARAALVKAQQEHKRQQIAYEEVCSAIRDDDSYQMSAEDSWDDHGRIIYKSEPLAKAEESETSTNGRAIEQQQ